MTLAWILQSFPLTNPNFSILNFVSNETPGIAYGGDDSDRLKSCYMVAIALGTRANRASFLAKIAIDNGGGVG